MKIAIPASVEDATAALNGLDQLLTAGEWKRAAIVAAFVDLGEGKGKSVGNATSSISCEAFAALGIAGLKSKDTVRRYVQAWLEQRPRPLPGEVIDMDGLPEWPTRYGDGKEKHGAARSPGQTAEALSDPAFVAKVLKSDKLSAEAVDALAEALVNNPEAHLAIARAQSKRATKEGVRSPKPEQDDHLSGFDVLLLSAALSHIRDFCRKTAALQMEGREFTPEFRMIVNQDATLGINLLTNIRDLVNNETRVYLTDEDLDALLAGGE